MFSFVTDSPFKKRPNRFIPSHQYAKDIKQKIAEANRTWSEYDDLNSSKGDNALDNENSDHRINDATLPNGRRRTVSFSDDVVVHMYQGGAESPFENSDNKS